MADVIYLIPDIFNPGKLVASDEPLGDPFNPAGWQPLNGSEPEAFRIVEYDDGSEWIIEPGEPDWED